MQTWRENMPQGMFLKSDGFASNLSDPGSTFTLEQFCDAEGIDYHRTRVPVALETFTRYGAAFQQKMVPELEDRRVESVSKGPNGTFLLRLDNGEEFTAGQVVLAVGISYFAFVPPEFQHLPETLVSHSSANRSAERFRGRKVVVYGAGASAADIAAMLHKGGAEVQIVARHKIKFNEPPGPKPRSVWKRLRHPESAIGPGLRSRFYTDAPGVFFHLPESLRLKIVKRHLGPAPGWAVKDQVVGHVPLLEGYTVAAARENGDQVQLDLTVPGGGRMTLDTDHVICATGYKVELRRIACLDREIVAGLRKVEDTPVLSTNFESSMPGLYFVGLAASNSFGPLLRFACGSDFAVRRIAAHLGGNTRRSV
jgi:thioredoxin reductase